MDKLDFDTLFKYGLTTMLETFTLYLQFPPISAADAALMRSPLPHGLTFCTLYFVMSQHTIRRGRAVAVSAGIVVDYLVEFLSSV